MNPSARRAAPLALLLATASALAATPAAPPKTPPAPGPVLDAMMSMAQELGAAAPPSMDVQGRIDALRQFRPSPATAAKLAKIYGSTPAWTLSEGARDARGTSYRAALAPLHFRDIDGSTVDWDAFQFEFGVRSDANAINAVGFWPSFTSSDKLMRVSVRKVQVEAIEQRSADKLWFGASWADIGSASFEPAGGGPAVRFEGIRTDQRIVDLQQSVQFGHQVQVRRISVGSEGIDNFRLTTRVTPVDRQTMLEMQALAPKDAPAGTPQERRAAMLPVLQAFTRGAIRSGTALEIEELRATFHGQTLRASGKLALEGAVPADADNLPALLKKLVLRLHVQAPLGLLREVTALLAEQQVKAKNKGVADPQAVAQLAASMRDLALGRMVSGGLVRVEGEQLISDIEYKGGLRINGKDVKLPALPTVPSMPGVTAAPPSLLQARRIDARCTLPPYPADVVKADAPLQLAMRLIVKADGSVRNVTLATPSGHPDFDQAVLAAASRCVYFPALRDGQPVDMPVVWKLVREPGSGRP